MIALTLAMLLGGGFMPGVGGGSSTAENFGTFTTTFGNGGRSTYDSAPTTVLATWIATSSAVLMTPKCFTTVGTNTPENCQISAISCSVTNIVVATSFDVVCVSPIHASGGYTISYTGG